jgi:hypothetical protein
MNILRLIIIAAAVVLLAACGGGGYMEDEAVDKLRATEEPPCKSVPIAHRQEECGI